MRHINNFESTYIYLSLVIYICDMHNNVQDPGWCHLWLLERIHGKLLDDVDHLLDRSNHELLRIAGELLGKHDLRA